MNFNKAEEYILGKLKKDLNPNLFYHCYHHTIDVFKSACCLAEMEKINENDLIILKTAALYHDSGFLLDYNNHEDESCKMVSQILPTFDYTSNEIEIIINLIKSTKLPQSPKTQLEKILCDADLDYIGRDDFFMIAHKLFCEWHKNGILISLSKWYQIQVDFLLKNNYFTLSAITLRDAKKKENLEEILNLLKEI